MYHTTVLGLFPIVLNEQHQAFSTYRAPVGRLIRVDLPLSPADLHPIGVSGGSRWGTNAPSYGPPKVYATPIHHLTRA